MLEAETTFNFNFSILIVSRAFLSVNNKEMKSESGFSIAMASRSFDKFLVSENIMGYVE